MKNPHVSQVIAAQKESGKRILVVAGTHGDPFLNDVI